jgi:hypothetical protein
MAGELSMFYVLATEVRRRSRRTGRSLIASTRGCSIQLDACLIPPNQEKCLTGMRVPSAALAIGHV